MAVYRLEDAVPRIDARAFVFANATVIGNVTLADGVTVWPSAVVRGDLDAVTVGANTNLQDGCVIHVAPGLPAAIGNWVTVGHQAMLHGCRVDDMALIGMQAVILDGAHVGRGCLVGAGAVVKEGQVIPEYAVVVGAPARVVRMMEPFGEPPWHRNAVAYRDLARRYAIGLKQIG